MPGWNISPENKNYLKWMGIGALAFGIGSIAHYVYKAAINSSNPQNLIEEHKQ